MYAANVPDPRPPSPPIDLIEPGRTVAWVLWVFAEIAIIATDIVFAIDSVPAVYGITSDPYLVFITNAFALLGLRALYFVLENALSKLVYLGYGLAVILGFIGVKLVLHWAHGVWPSVPEIPTLLSLVVIVVILTVTIVASLMASVPLMIFWLYSSIRCWSNRCIPPSRLAM